MCFLLQCVISLKLLPYNVHMSIPLLLQIPKEISVSHPSPPFASSLSANWWDNPSCSYIEFSLERGRESSVEIITISLQTAQDLEANINKRQKLYLFRTKLWGFILAVAVPVPEIQRLRCIVVPIE